MYKKKEGKNMSVIDLIEFLPKLDPSLVLDKCYIETEPGNFLELKSPVIDDVGDLIFQRGEKHLGFIGISLYQKSITNSGN